MKILYFLIFLSLGASAQTKNDFQSLYIVVNGREYSNSDFSTLKNGNNALVLKGKKLPLEINLVLKEYNGVFTRSMILKNMSNEKQVISKIPSLYFRLPLQQYSLQYLKTVWGNERRLEETSFNVDSNFSFVVNKGRSGEGYSSWFSLTNNKSRLRYMAQLAYSANWEMHFSRSSDGKNLVAEMGMLFDEGKGMTLEPGKEFAVPEAAFTVGFFSLDEAANKLHRYQREHVIPAVKTNDPLLVEYNTWYSAPDKVYVNDVKKLVDAAAELGCEAFVQDAGWYNEKNDWGSNLGDFFATKSSFPNGLEELSNYVHSKNMLFGLWVEIESAGVESIVYREHPGWFLQREGKPVFTSRRHHFNFANDSAWNWALETISRLVKDYRMNWIKIDYNNAVGNRFDEGYKGLAMYDHLNAYFRLLDTVHRRFPELIVENCASGGLRTDLGTMKHTNTAWVSDETTPERAPQLSWGANLEFVPEINNYWMTGDTSVNGSWFCKTPKHAGWWDYMFKIAMNGQFGISSRLDRWSDPLKQTAKQNIQLYKKVRDVIKGADVYHLTGMPDHAQPKGAMALQYQHNKKNVLTTYRFEEGRATENFVLKNLVASKNYTIALNGENKGTLSGKSLMSTGIAVSFPYEFSSALLEIDEAD